ncbi:MAG: MATE family efflux transporter, partial [Syntrophomonas sp.]
ITVILILKLMKKREYLPWSIKNFKPSLKVLVDIYTVAIPSTIMEILGVVVMVLLNRVVAGFGITFLAALGIFLRIRSLFFMSVYGLSQGTLPIAGFAYGARKYDRVKETIIKSSVISLIFTVTSWIIIQLYPIQIMGFFSNDIELIQIGVNCMRLATIFLPVMGPIIIFYTVLQAMGKGMTAMWLSIIRQGVLFLPLFIILPRYIGINGVWWSFSLSEMLSALLTAFFLIIVWRELQTRRKLGVIMLFKPQFLWNRIAAWLKW